MALLLAVGTAATDMSVYAAETKTQEGTIERKRKRLQDCQILRTTRERDSMTGKSAWNRPASPMMPQSIDVYLDGGKETTSIPVTWSCVGDYDTTNYFVYEFDPKWDTDQYSLGAGQKGQNSIHQCGDLRDKSL